MNRFLLATITAALLSAPNVVSAKNPAHPTAIAPVDRLRDQIALLAKATDGVVGVAVQRVEGGPLVTLNGDTSFPMASTFKIAVAATAFDQVAKGKLHLDQMVDVDPSMFVESQGIQDQLRHPGISLSVINLVELMLNRSDNTATDVLVDLVGGPREVTAWLRSAGVTGQQVDSDTNRLILRALDVTPEPGTFEENRQRAYAADPFVRERDTRSIPNPAFDADPRDSSTPEAMAAMLGKIARGEVLRPDHSKLLMEILHRCVTGRTRLPGLLPAGTPVAHKTGSLFGIANDVGIITLPGDRGAIVIAVFVKGDTRGVETRERIIAEIARSAFDFYLFN